MLEHFNQATRIIIGTALAVIIWIVGIVIGQEQTITILNPAGGWSSIFNRSPVIEVSLMLDYGNGLVQVYRDVNLTYGDSVLDLLDKVNQPENNLRLSYQFNSQTGGLSQLSIGGLRSYDGGKEWLAWVNNELQTESFNLIKLKAKEVVELKYIKLKDR